MALSEGQIITYMTDEVINTLSNICPMAQRVTKYTPPAAEMQRSSNTYWLPVEQQMQTQEGWDLTGKAGNILELSVPCTIGEPDNDFFTLRADDVRDETALRRRISASAKKLASNVEMAISRNATDTGSLVVTTGKLSGAGVGDAAGWDFLASGESLIFARELDRNAGISFFMNATDYKASGYNLVGKDMFGRIPEDAYKNGAIGEQIAGFDTVLRSPKMPTVTGSASTGVTISGAQSFKPEAFTTDADGNKINVDNRVATVKLSAAHGLKRGDKFSVAGVKFLSEMTKEVLPEDATFTVVSVAGQNVTIMPKPVAKDDNTLTPEQAAYANVSTSFADAAAVTVLNTTTAASNVFWADDSITLVSQPIPLTHELFSGMKAEPFSIPEVGLNGVIAYQGDINTFSGKCRIALWYGVCNKRPEAVGVGLANQ